MTRKRKCPQCQIPSFFVKNEKGERRLVYILQDGNIVAKYPEESLDGFNLDEVFCLGCSWNGNSKRLLD